MPAAITPKTRNGSSRGWLVVVLLLAGAAAAVVFVLPRYGISLLDFRGGERTKTSPPPDDVKSARWDAEAVKRMREDLKRWKNPPGEKDSDAAVAAAYLATLSFFPPDKALTESSHPDAVFARRFPKPTATRNNEPLTPAEFVDRLRRLVKDLGAEKVPEEWNQKDLVVEIGNQADYMNWFKWWAKAKTKDGAGLRARATKDALVYPLAQPDDVSFKFAARFIPPSDSSAEVRSAAAGLIKQLKGWGMDGIRESDAELRPAYVARIYLHFVSLHDFDDPDKDIIGSRDWHAAFLKKFPKKPVGDGLDLAIEDDLNKALAELLKIVGGPPGARLPSRVSNLQKTLDYGAWLEAARQDSDNPAYKDYVFDDSLLPARVVEFAERFRVKPKKN